MLSPSVDVVGLVEYFCTHPIYICGFSSEEDHVVLAFCKMLLLAHYSEPELETVWVVLWCITVAVLLLIIICIECSPPRRFVR